jgi:hypothetical protein
MFKSLQRSPAFLLELLAVRKESGILRCDAAAVGWSSFAFGVYTVTTKRLELCGDDAAFFARVAFQFVGKLEPFANWWEAVDHVHGCCFAKIAVPE